MQNIRQTLLKAPISEAVNFSKFYTNHDERCVEPGERTRHKKTIYSLYDTCQAGLF